MQRKQLEDQVFALLEQREAAEREGERERIGGKDHEVAEFGHTEVR